MSRVSPEAVLLAAATLFMDAAPAAADARETPKATDVESLKRHGVEVALMSGVGHFLQMEDPERFNGLLRATIEKLGR